MCMYICAYFAEFFNAHFIQICTRNSTNKTSMRDVSLWDVNFSKAGIEPMLGGWVINWVIN